MKRIAAAVIRAPKISRLIDRENNIIANGAKGTGVLNSVRPSDRLPGHAMVGRTEHTGILASCIHGVRTARERARNVLRGPAPRPAIAQVCRYIETFRVCLLRGVNGGR